MGFPLRLRGPKILARRYVRPEKIGLIFVPDTVRQDGTRSLWEVVESTDAANKELRCELRQDWILVTPRNSGVYWGLSAANEEIFLLAASSVRRIIPWTSGDQMKLKGTCVMVRPDKAPEKRGALIVATAAFEKMPITGEVVEVGSAIKDPDIALGARVLYSIHAGTALTVDGKEHMILEEAQVLAILGDEHVEVA